jgi:DUF4097 and DUF4098 domain-containing protein YvlB
VRPRSIAGPIILIAIGGAFLLNNLMPELSYWRILGHYWPFLIIAFGVIRLVEVLTFVNSGKPLPPRGVGGGQIALLVLVCVVFWAVSQNRGNWTRMGRIESGSLELFGEQYDYPVSAKTSASGITLLVLDNLRGNLTISGGDTPECVIEGRKTVHAFHKNDADDYDRRSQIHFVREGNQLIVRSDEGRISGEHRISTDLDIKAPRNVTIQARGRSGDLTISSFDGSVDVSSDRGDVRLSDIAGNAKVDLNHSGLIRVVDVKGNVDVQGRGSDVQFQNIAGQVTINGSYSGTLDFKNLAKPLHFESSQTEMRIAQLPGSLTMDLGDVRATNIVGPMRLRTKSRDIHIDGFTDAMELEIERGDVELTPGRAPLAKIDVHLRNGNIALALPDKAAFDLKANTSQGDAHNDYGDGVKVDVAGRSASLRSVESKGPAITVTTDRGTVSVRKS